MGRAGEEAGSGTAPGPSADTCPVVQGSPTDTITPVEWLTAPPSPSRDHGPDQNCTASPFLHSQSLIVGMTASETEQ